VDFNDVDLNLSGGVGVDLDGDLDVGLDEIRILELPTIEIAPLFLELGFRPTRVHFPVHLDFCFRLCGFDLMSLSVCGEAMTIIEDYHPHRTERCR